MDFLYSTEVAVPLYQIGILLSLSTVALLFRRVKLALLVNYLFTVYWGYVVKRDSLFIHAQNPEMEGFYILAYMAFGILVVLLAVIAFLTQD
ncbi:MAG: hypothetical protein JRI97_08425 [Deltaproteobacteria bacterium]|nr:hypothetical protein [Deltaproteobacteria bacterium]